MVCFRAETKVAGGSDVEVLGSLAPLTPSSHHSFTISRSLISALTCSGWGYSEDRDKPGLVLPELTVPAGKWTCDMAGELSWGAFGQPQSPEGALPGLEVRGER